MMVEEGGEDVEEDLHVLVLLSESLMLIKTNQIWSVNEWA